MPKAKLKKYYHKKAWDLFSIFIRKRDSDWRENVKCITCNWIGSWKECDAGHYIHGKGKGTYFNEKNVHAQCSRCNKWKSGELGVYAHKIIQKYGLKAYQELEDQRYREHYWTIKALKEIIKKYEN